MPWITGTVPTFTNKLITLETFDTGDGIQTVYSGSVANAGNFIENSGLKFTIGAVVYGPILSDSNGDWTHAELNSGSIQDDGTIALDFVNPPDIATNIQITYTTKGIAERVKEAICDGEQYDEVLATGDGSTVTFNYSPTGGAYLAKGQVLLKVTIGGAKYWIYDNGSGEFIHDEIVSSTVNYATPEIDVEFANPPDDTIDIELVYTDSSTEGRDWLIYRNELAQTNVGADAFPGLLLREYIFRNSGVTYIDDLAFGLRESQNIATNQYLLELNLYEEFDEAYFNSDDWNYNGLNTSFDAATKHWTSHPSFAAADLSMTYWIKATKSAVVINIKVAGTVYTSGMAGVGTRFSSKENYPNPCFIIGNNTGNFIYTSVAAAHSMILDPVATDHLQFIKQNGGLSNFRIASVEGARVQPTSSYLDSGNVGKTTNSKVILYECFFEGTVVTPKMLFQIPEVYHVPFADMTTEDELNEAGDDFKVFQNIFRTSSFDYYAVRMTD